MGCFHCCANPVEDRWPERWRKRGSRVRAKKLHLALLGLDGSGKSSLLFALQHPLLRSGTPTARPSSAAGSRTGWGGMDVRRSFLNQPTSDVFSSALVAGPDRADLGRAGGAVSDGSDLSAAPLVGAFDDPLGCNDDLGDDALGNLAPPPTVAIQRADINVKGLNVAIADLPGRAGERSKWREELPHCTAIVLVVDATDVLRMPVVRHELWKLEALLKELQVPCLVLANKQDLPGACSAKEVRLQLRLDALEARLGIACAVRPSTAADAAQLVEALDWLLTHAGSTSE
eukprot:CAMPEP_0198219476 /NCGR_PEP_ID=MMETSP1445-20131203/74501_1 /TAXON_ID=36898 /ORGANISM="Pyramimonas sp., Strain CCMP2087" /LENGTH=287 /DNA_ID=CAMNT_0043896885 /DNA_START=263 /DNA_END=1126 /DNA_ORIENTATION=-